MVTLTKGRFQNIDLALSDGTLLLPLMVEWGIPTNHYFHTGPIFHQGDDLLVERRDNTDQMSENKMDGIWWDSQRSWHLGAGQQRFDAATSSPYAFWTSKGIDISTPGQATLLSATKKVLALTDNSSPPVITVTDTAVYVASTQPNLKRFGQLDASDASSVSTGTETSQAVRSLTSDGVTVYAGLGPDGIHRSGGYTYTQREAFDSTTGWSGTGSGQLSADTANKHEGTASLHLTGDGSIDVSKSISSFASSGVDGFSLWFYWSGGPMTDMRIRLKTDNSNYFERSLSALNTAAGGWYNDISFKGAWTQVGTPGSIVTVELLRVPTNHVFTLDDATFGTLDTPTNVLSPIIADVWIDDLESFVVSSMSHWSDHDARVVAWVKNSVYAAGLQASSQTTWEFYNAASGAGSTIELILPDGYIVSDICELGPYIYFSAYRAGRGVVYCYDGTNAPFVAGVLPIGDQPLSLTPFLGAGILIGAGRINAGSGKQGVVYRAFPSSDGHLTIERIATIGTANDGNDYGVRCGTQYGDNAYFGWSFADTVSGLGTYLPSSGGYSRHLDADALGIVRGMAVYAGRRIFTIDGVGVYVEQSSLVSSGQIVGSVMDYNIDALKMLVYAEAGYLSLPAGASVQLEWSSDNGATWNNVGSDFTAGDTSFRGQVEQKVTQAQYRVTISGGNVTLKKAGLGSMYGKKPAMTHNVFIRAYSRQEQKNLLDYLPYPTEELSSRMVAQLKAWYKGLQLLTFYPVDWDISGQTPTVRISAIDAGYIYEPGSGRRDTIHLELTEIPGV